MAKSEETPERLELLRSQLEVAEGAASTVPEDADDEIKAAAENARAAAEKALAEAHIEEQKRAEAAAQEQRAIDEGNLEAILSLQDLIQAGTTQNVRGTDKLNPEEHARRRNPTRN